jgi:hypothetical protein
VKTEGRKGTRAYAPDESEDYKALVEGQEKATATHDATPQEKLERCMASWDSGTHITKPNWRKISSVSSRMAACSMLVVGL